MAFPAEFPAFLRTPQAVADIGEYSREPDRAKGVGKLFDSEHSPAHFVDLGEDGLILGGPALSALPPNRADYDTALRAVGQDSWKAGYLPYAILDSEQALTRQFAYWRVLKYAEADPKWRAHRAWYTADRRRREAQILQAIGQLSHFVGDGSQPLHVTIHFNGWGNFPNPNGYSNAKLHGPFEGDLVQASFSTVMAFSDPGDAVLLQLPSYPPFMRAIEEVMRFRSWPKRRTLRHSLPCRRSCAMQDSSMPPEPQVGS